MVQLARKWMVATGTNPSMTAQKPNDDTIAKSCMLSRMLALPRLIIVSPAQSVVGGDSIRFKF
jgi:hypothetical protein